MLSLSLPVSTGLKWPITGRKPSSFNFAGMSKEKVQKRLSEAPCLLPRRALFYLKIQLKVMNYDQKAGKNH